MKNKNIAEIELVYHNPKTAKERLVISGAVSAYRALIDTWDKNKLELQEQFRILLLDRKNACLGVSTLATGGVSSCLVDLKLAFATALKARASGMILAHNHPSGSKIFSSEDFSLTAKFHQAGKILDVQILDHILITNDGHTSMAEIGMMPPP